MLLSAHPERFSGLPLAGFFYGVFLHINEEKYINIFFVVAEIVIIITSYLGISGIIDQFCAYDQSSPALVHTLQMSKLLHLHVFRLALLRDKGIYNSCPKELD